MGALGAVGGVGGLGSYGDSDSSGPDAQIESDAASASIGSWYDANSVMSTSGEVDGQGTVQLDDGDLSSKYLLGGQDGREDPFAFPLPPAGGQPAVADGVGDAPTAEVVNRVAAVYAANSGGGGDQSGGW